MPVLLFLDSVAQIDTVQLRAQFDTVLNGQYCFYIKKTPKNRNKKFFPPGFINIDIFTDYVGKHAYILMSVINPVHDQWFPAFEKDTRYSK